MKTSTRSAAALDRKLAAIFASEAPVTRKSRTNKAVAAPVPAKTAITPDAVNAAAAAVLDQGYGDCAYICDVAAHMGLTVAELGPALVTMNRAGSVKIHRADLVRAMPAAKLQGSLVELWLPGGRSEYPTAIFHLVQVGTR